MNRKKSRETVCRVINGETRPLNNIGWLCTEEIPWYFAGRNVDAALQNFLMSRYVAVTVIFVTYSHG